MSNRLLILLLSLVLLFGCAKLPEMELHETRSLVAQAYATGASRLAAAEYQLASSALHRAEQLIIEGKYRKAKNTLALAERYADEAIQLTRVRKAEHEAELERQRLEELAAEAARRAEQERAERARKALEKPQKTVVPPKTPKKKPAVPAVKPKPEVVLVDSVVVAAGEDLAVISGRPEVYADKLLWPLIYKANRDQIKDPQEIFSGQVLLIPRDKSADEIAAARQEALELDLF